MYKSIYNAIILFILRLYFYFKIIFYSKIKIEFMNLYIYYNIMTNRTYEEYDENEYFLKYLSIHPILIYSNNDLDKYKRKYQEYLLNLFNLEKITYDELNDQYNLLVRIENNNNIILDEIHEKHKNIEKKIKKNNEINLINLCNNLMKN